MYVNTNAVVCTFYLRAHFFSKRVQGCLVIHLTQVIHYSCLRENAPIAIPAWLLLCDSFFIRILLAVNVALPKAFLVDLPTHFHINTNICI